jgi:hypothetical protein
MKMAKWIATKELVFEQRDGGCVTICECCHKEDAKLIAQAVNAHEPMMQVLEELRSMLKSEHAGRHWQAAVRQTNAALRIARGEE